MPAKRKIQKEDILQEYKLDIALIKTVVTLRPWKRAYYSS